MDLELTIEDAEELRNCIDHQLGELSSLASRAGESKIGSAIRKRREQLKEIRGRIECLLEVTDEQAVLNAAPPQELLIW